MTTKELKEKVRVEWRGYGSYKVTISFRGKEYTCITHNSEAYDRIREGEEGDDGYYTYKQALLALWNECKRWHDLP